MRETSNDDMLQTTKQKAKDRKTLKTEQARFNTFGEHTQKAAI
jgi:hypothetical protein